MPRFVKKTCRIQSITIEFTWKYNEKAERHHIVIDEVHRLIEEKRWYYSDDYGRAFEHFIGMELRAYLSDKLTEGCVKKW